MAGKSIEQRMADTEERIRQLEARKQTLAQAIKQQEHKDRTRRLIQIGGILARLGVDSVEKAQAPQQAVECKLAHQGMAGTSHHASDGTRPSYHGVEVTREVDRWR